MHSVAALQERLVRRRPHNPFERTVRFWLKRHHTGHHSESAVSRLCLGPARPGRELKGMARWPGALAPREASRKRTETSPDVEPRSRLDIKCPSGGAAGSLGIHPGGAGVGRSGQVRADCPSPSSSPPDPRSPVSVLQGRLPILPSREASETISARETGARPTVTVGLDLPGRIFP